MPHGEEFSNTLVVEVEGRPLPASVVEWEPSSALVAGPAFGPADDALGVGADRLGDPVLLVLPDARIARR